MMSAFGGQQKPGSARPASGFAPHRTPKTAPGIGRVGWRADLPGSATDGRGREAGTKQLFPVEGLTVGAPAVVILEQLIAAHRDTGSSFEQIEILHESS